MSDTPRDCKHGRLARKCSICELESELAAVTKQRDVAFALSKCECGPEECCRNLVEAQKKIADLEENERAYARILGKRSYQEVADELAAAQEAADRLSKGQYSQTMLDAAEAIAEATTLRIELAASKQRMK